MNKGGLSVCLNKYFLLNILIAFKVTIWSFLLTMIILVSLGRDSAPVPFSCPFLDGGVISYLHGSCYLSKKGPASVSYRSPRVHGRHVIVAFLINTRVSLCKVESAQCAFGKRQVWVFDVANWCLPLPIDIRLLLIDIWRFYLSPMH